MTFEQERKFRTERFFENYKKNPHPRVLLKMVEEAREHDLRGILVNGDMYWWKSEHGTHRDGWRWLALALEWTRLNGPDGVPFYSVRVGLDEPIGYFEERLISQVKATVIKEYDQAGWEVRIFDHYILFTHPE